MSQLKSGGSEYIADRGLTFVATALGRAGRFEEALATLEEAFLFIERTGQKYYQAELYRLKGELLLGHDMANAAAAEQSFHRALDRGSYAQAAASRGCCDSQVVATRHAPCSEKFTGGSPRGLILRT